MAWSLKRISNNKERAAQSIREALEEVRQNSHGRGHGATASAIEAALQAFGNVNGLAIEITTNGDISVDGKGYLTISLTTIDPEVMV